MVQTCYKNKKYFKSRDRHLMCHLLFSEGNHLLRTRKKRYIKSYHCGQRVRLPKG